MQAVEDVLLVGDRAARLVGVLEAQHERAAGVAGVQVVEQRRPGGPDVERTGRARGDPDARDASVIALAIERARDHVEERRIGVAGQDPDERGRPEAERRAAARAVERQRVQRLAAGEDRDVGAGRQGAGLEVRQQAGVLLGLLGDPVDRRVLARLDLAQRDARPVAGGRSRRRSGCRAGRSRGWPSISSSRASTRGEIAPWRRIASSSDSAQPSPMTEVSSHSSSAWRRKIAVGRGPTGAASGARSRPSAWRDEPVGDEPAEHLAGGLGGDAEVAGDLGGGHPPASSEPAITRRASRYSWAAVGQVALVVAAGHDLRIRDASGTGRPDPPRDGDREPDEPGDHEHDAEGRPARIAVGGGAGRRQDERGERRRPTSRVSERDRRRATAEAGTAGAARASAELEREQRSGLGRAVAGGREPAAAGQLADQPAEAERDRQPADDRADDPAAAAAGTGVGEGAADVGHRRRPRSGGGVAAAPVAAAGGRGRALGARQGRRRRRTGSAPRPAGRVPRTSRGVRLGRGRCPAGSAPAHRRRRRGRRVGPRSGVGGSPVRGAAASATAAAARRARAWYSGPCLRGSAYSFGLIVQYVPLVVPYQLAPPQSGSNGLRRRRRTRSSRASPCSAAVGGRDARGRRRRPRSGAAPRRCRPAGSRRSRVAPSGAARRRPRAARRRAPAARRRRSRRGRPSRRRPPYARRAAVGPIGSSRLPYARRVRRRRSASATAGPRGRRPSRRTGSSTSCS